MKDQQWERKCEEVRQHLRKKKKCITIKGGLVEVSLPSSPRTRTWIHKRNPVTEFSRTSRLRMLKMSAKLDWVKLPNPLFVTLTLPDAMAQPAPEVMKSWRDEFVKSMENYLLEELPIIWRVEWVPRLTGSLVGTFCPHLHLLVFTKGFLPMAWVRDTWMDVIGEKTYAQTQVKRGKKTAAAAAYLAKYCAKCERVPPCLVIGTYRGTGRHWGIRRPRLFCWGRVLEFDDISDEELFIFVRAAARAMKHFDWICPTSFTLFGEEARKAVEEFRAKRVDRGEGDW